MDNTSRYTKNTPENGLSDILSSYGFSPSAAAGGVCAGRLKMKLLPPACLSPHVRPTLPTLEPGGAVGRRMLPTPPRCCALHHSVCVYESLCVRELLHRCLCESFLCFAEHLSWRIHFGDASFCSALPQPADRLRPQV